MTASDTFALFGDSIPVTYFNGTDYVTVNATNDFGGVTKFGTLVVDGVSVPVVFYQVLNIGDLNSNASYITLQLAPQYSIYDSYFIYQCCGMSSYSTIASANFSAPSWLFHVAGSDIQYEGVADSGLYTSEFDLAYFFGSYWASTYMNHVWVDYEGQSETFGYSKRIRFFGNTASQFDNVVFFLSCPYISGDAFGSSGTPASSGSGSGGSGDVNVNIDMSETNSILSGLAGSIVNGILGLFVPSQEDFEEFVQDARDTFSDAFDPVFPSVTVISSVFDDILEQSEDSSQAFITLEQASFSVGGGTFKFPPDRVDGQLYKVPLIPDGFGWFADIVKGVVDIVCTIAVLNTIKTKFELFLNPAAETIIE